MIVRTLALGVLFFVTFSNALAQDAKVKTPDHAQLRADCYGQALGLDAKETARMKEALVKGEQEVADLRAQVAALQVQIEERMAPHDAAAEKSLTKDQRNTLEALRKSGWKPCSEPCSPATATSCSGKEGAKGAACCSGTGTGAKVEKAKPAPPAPNATME